MGWMVNAVFSPQFAFLVWTAKMQMKSMIPLNLS